MFAFNTLVALIESSLYNLWSATNILAGTGICDRMTTRRPSMIGEWLSGGKVRKLPPCDAAILLIFLRVDLMFFLRAVFTLLVATLVEAILFGLPERCWS